jgi:hypothetical protein
MDELTPTHHVEARARKALRMPSDHIPERLLASSPAGLVSNQVALREIFDVDDDFVVLHQLRE